MMFAMATARYCVWRGASAWRGQEEESSDLAQPPLLVSTFHCVWNVWHLECMTSVVVSIVITMFSLCSARALASCE